MYNRYLPYQYNRSVKQPQPTRPVPLPKPPTPKKAPPPKQKTQKKKFDFKSLKKNTCTSLNDVECFLNNFSNTWKYIRLIKLLK